MNDMGHNKPPPWEAISLRVEELLAGAARMEQAIKVCEDQETAEKLGGFKRQLQAALNESEKARKDEKDPHLRAGQEVDAKWGSVKRKLDAALASVLDKLTIWGNLQEKRRNEELARIQAEADAKERERLAAEAELAKAQAQTIVDDPAIREPLIEALQAKADNALVESALAEQKIETILAAPITFGKEHHTAGTKPVGMKSHYSTIVADTRLAAFFFRDHPDILEVIRRLALPALKRGELVPGCELREERKAS